MTVSQARLNANRRNAQLSTGPRTEEGKAKSSRNALTHGLTAESSPVLPNEDPQIYSLFHQQMQDDLHPRTAVEELLVERITSLLWRLRRLPSTEAELLKLDHEQQNKAIDKRNQTALFHYKNMPYRDRQAEPPPTPEPEELFTPSRILSRFFTSKDDKTNPLLKLHRYECSLERSLTRCLKQLKDLQKQELPASVPEEQTDAVPEQIEPIPPTQNLTPGPDPEPPLPPQNEPIPDAPTPAFPPHPEPATRNPEPELQNPNPDSSKSVQSVQSVDSPSTSPEQPPEAESRNLSGLSLSKSESEPPNVQTRESVAQLPPSPPAQNPTPPHDPMPRAPIPPTITPPPAGAEPPHCLVAR